MSEEEMIKLARDYTPEAVRVLVEGARQVNDGRAKKNAIAQLCARGFLTSSNPSDDELLRIENMSDEEIRSVFQRAMS